MSAFVLYEDAHLLVVNKPSGINTHKPDRFAPDGIHEWLTKRESHWSNLSILHRLDKDTSGVLVFGKSRRANQSLARQFETHQVGKNYLLLSAARPTRGRFLARSHGAETEFEFLQPHGRFFLVRARPITGKTHQVRCHAAENGFPIAGDREYGGEDAPRLMLHAHTISLAHPESGGTMTLEASIPDAFDKPDALVAAKEFRDLLFDEQTDAYRLIAGVADGFPDVAVDWYAGAALVQWQTKAALEAAGPFYERLRETCRPAAILEQLATKQQRTPPRVVLPATGLAESLSIQENGLRFEVRFGHGLSTGIFLDQRENRRRLLDMQLSGKSVLNCFAYTCGFSVAAAKAGATVISIDLSRQYLNWGRENFRVNGLDDAGNEFITGDVLEWLKRFVAKGRRWDIVILDPPTFATTKKGRAFQAARDYLKLESLAIPLVTAGGSLFCSSNQRTLPADKFEVTLREAAKQSNRIIESMDFETQPFDFRVASGERPFLKTFWARLGD